MPPTSQDILEKEDLLRKLIQDIGSCIVAFSGGVDSAYLSFLANDVLGERALSVTADSPSYPEYQRRAALEFVAQFGIRHELIRTSEIDNPDYARNPSNRCYFCKQELFTLLRRVAEERSFKCVIDGNNLDDTGDFRPGRKAGRELQVRSPLIEAGMRKSDVRSLSRLHGLPTWDQPASACLSSRIPYGSPVTIEKLKRIDRGEEFLRSLGFRQFRVRHHDDLARLEFAPEEIASALQPEMFSRFSVEFRRLGFQFVAVDVDGYRQGSLNEVLTAITPADTPSS